MIIVILFNFVILFYFIFILININFYLFNVQVLYDNIIICFLYINYKKTFFLQQYTAFINKDSRTLYFSY